MPEYEAVIGLEVHVHLATASKLFCSCPNSFGDEPNTNVCEVCAGMPGVLPVLNAKAVEYACRMALAVHAEINRRSQFARKNYFYALKICECGALHLNRYKHKLHIL